MEKLSEILHELIDAAKHALTPNRIGELHKLADDVDAAAKATAEASGTLADATAPAPSTPPAVSGVTPPPAAG